MIWTIPAIDTDLIAAIDAHIARNGQRHQPARLGVKRYSYLLATEPRISLACVGMPLPSWQGGAFLLVGTREIIGEFAGNAAMVGRKGLQLKMQPLHWMTGQADRVFASGEALLAEISEQILDSKAIERTQRTIKNKYSW